MSIVSICAAHQIAYTICNTPKTTQENLCHQQLFLKNTKNKHRLDYWECTCSLRGAYSERGTQLGFWSLVGGQQQVSWQPDKTVACTGRLGLQQQSRSSLLVWRRCGHRVVLPGVGQTVQLAPAKLLQRSEHRRVTLEETLVRHLQDCIAVERCSSRQRQKS